MAKLPPRFLKVDHIADLEVGQSGWVKPVALVIDTESYAYLNPEETAATEKEDDDIWVQRFDEEHFVVKLCETSYRWCPTDNIPRFYIKVWNIEG